MRSNLNVLLIIADQFRWDCLGATGNTIIRTPHLDALATQGVSFDHCFVQTCPCGPSRMCIYTGRYLCSTRAVNNYTPLADAHENLAIYVKEAGYATAIVGYNDYAIDPRILPAGDPRTTGLRFDNFLPGFDYTSQHEYHSPEYFAMLRARGYPEHLCGPTITTAYNVPADGPGDHLPLRYPAFYTAKDSESTFLAEKASDYIREHGDGGWMLSVNFIKPHPPRICPAPYNDMYDPRDLPEANRRTDELRDPHPYLQMAHTSPALVTDLELRETRACYYGMISEIDTCVGSLVTTLKQSGQWDRTLVIFTSDHGEYLGDHYLIDKGHFYDETMRVPLIIRDPTRMADATRGRRFDAFVESIDIAPTILDFLRADIPDRMQGRSVLGAIRDPATAQARNEIHFEFDFRGRFEQLKGEDPEGCLLWVVRDREFKYVQFGLESMRPLLYDLRSDPGEHCNLAEDAGHAPRVAAYCQRLLRWRMKHEDQRMERWAGRYRE